jgi:hypothetical protein
MSFSVSEALRKRERREENWREGEGEKDTTNQLQSRSKDELGQREGERGGERERKRATARGGERERENCVFFFRGERV